MSLQLLSFSAAFLSFLIPPLGIGDASSAFGSGDGSVASSNSNVIMVVDATNTEATTTTTATTSSSSASATTTHPTNGDEIFDFELLSTNDLHSSFEGSGPDYSFTAAAKDGDPTNGHYARLCQMIGDRRRMALERGEPSLTVDAGDWFAGTLFHIVGPSHKSIRVPELEFFHTCGFDATTLGNHDFESGLSGLSTMLLKAQRLGLKTPIIASNMEINTMPPEFFTAGMSNPNVELTEDDDDETEKCNNEILEEAAAAEKSCEGEEGEEAHPHHHPNCYRSIHLEHAAAAAASSSQCVHSDVLRPLAVKTLKNAAGKKLRVGLIGLHGPDACLCNLWNRQPLKFVGFEDEEKASHYDILSDHVDKLVKTLRNEHYADLVIVLAHMGHPEDTKLAQAVEGIDVIVSAHTHGEYLEMQGSTFVVQTYMQGQYLRAMPLRATKQLGNDRWTVSLRGKVEDTLLPVDDRAHVDDGIMDLMHNFKKEIDTVIQSSHWGGNLSYSRPLYMAPEATALFGADWNDAKVARVVGDCLLGAMSEGSRRHNPPQVFLGLAGMVRGLPRPINGKFSLQFSDLFKMFQTGFDLPSMTPGTPLCTFYMTKNELWHLLEIGELVRRFWQEDFIVVPSSRLQVSFSRGVPFINHMQATLDDKKFKDWPEQIHVASICTLSQALYSCSQVTHGLVSLWPRHENGTIIPTEEQLRAESHDIPNPYALLSDYLQQHSTNSLKKSRHNDVHSIFHSAILP